MDYILLLQRKFDKINDNIKYIISKNIEEYNEIGLSNSTICYHKSIEKGIKTLEIQLKIFIKELTKLNTLDIYVWNDIFNRCNNYIIQEIDFIIKYTKDTISSNYNFTTNQNGNNILTDIKLIIEIHKANIVEKRNQKWWDIIKMVGSAILGSVLTILTKYIIDNI